MPTYSCYNLFKARGMKRSSRHLTSHLRMGILLREHSNRWEGKDERESCRCGWERLCNEEVQMGPMNAVWCNMYDTKRRSRKQILKNPEDSQRGWNSSIKVYGCHSVTFLKTGTYIRLARGSYEDQRTNTTKMRHVLERIEPHPLVLSTTLHSTIPKHISGVHPCT